MGELARVGCVDHTTAADWVHELILRGYAVVDEDVCTVSDDPTDLPGTAAPEDEGADDGPRVVWAALRAAQANGHHPRPVVQRGAINYARLTDAEREALTAALDSETAAGEGNSASESVVDDEQTSRSAQHGARDH